MSLSRLMGKKIINIFDGDILGTVGDSDLVIDCETGEIRSLILPHKKDRGMGRRDLTPLTIPWDSVCKIGTEVIVVDIQYY